MHQLRKFGSKSFLARVTAAGAMASMLSVGLPLPAFADAAPSQLAPLTKLRLTVVQFMPTTGDYRRWDALGGDLVVSPDGSVLVPTLGSIPAGDLSPDQLAAVIADKLQAKLGLVDRPDASVQIVEYPPIYLVGSVATPGQYPFRPGMTVLQAVAVAGGQLRATDKGTPTDTIKLQSELQALADDVLRSTARIARFDAELSDAKEITFPADLGGDNSLAVQTMNQEKTIFAARQNELGRQTAALSDLTALYRAQLDVLDQKSQSIDDQLKQAQEQLDGVKQLVHNGTITISRQTDLERAVSGLRSDHLDNLIATMSARQGLNEATRNLAKLEDDHRSEVSQALQTEQTNLEKLRLTQTTTMRLLRQSTEFAVDAKDEPKNTDNLVYTIVREQSGQAQQVAASDSTVLAPGDLVKVAVNVSAVANGLAAAPAVPTNAITTGSLQ